MKIKATHRGNCQMCGHEHHYMGPATGLAHHGYTVEYNRFRGVCHGTGKKPMQLERKLTDNMVAQLHEIAAEHDAAAEGYRSGNILPRHIKTGEKLNRQTYKYEPVYIDFAAGTPDQQKKAVAIHVWEEEQGARGARTHAKQLKDLCDRVHGTPLVLIVDEPKAAKVEAVVDVKAAKVYGTFSSKTARKNELDKLNRAYSRKIDELQTIYLAIPHDARTPAQTEVYYAPHDLHNWRPRHAAAALKEFPQAAEIVQTITELVAAREAIKAAP